MKSSETLPPITSATATIRLQQERQRRRMVLQDQQMMAPAVTDASSSMIPMKPIILSRKRRSGISGVDRKKLAELLNEALSLSMHFDLDANRNTSADDEETTDNDKTMKK